MNVRRGLLSFVSVRPGRRCTELMLQGIVDELRNFHAALTGHLPSPLKELAIDLNAGLFGNRHVVSVAALNSSSTGCSTWESSWTTRDGGLMK